MAVYEIADVKVTNDAWVQEYAKNVHDIVHKLSGSSLYPCRDCQVSGG